MKNNNNNVSEIKYDNKNTQAQVDQDYLVITRTINGRTETYLRYEYSHKAGACR